MKGTRNLIITLLFIAGTFLSANAWEGITLSDFSARNQMEEAPKDALNEATKAFDEALKQQDTPAVLAALIKWSTAQTLIDQDSLPALIARAETVANQSTNPVEQSMIRLYTTDLYKQFISYNYQIAYRTEINDFTLPIEAWSLNMVQERIDTLFSQALAPAKTLQATPISRYAQALELGTDTIFRPTLYDFALGKTINFYHNYNNTPAPYISTHYDLIPTQAFISAQKEFDNRILQLYAKALKAHANNEMSAPFMMWDLQRIEYLSKDIYYYDKEEFDNYINELKTILNHYQSLPYSVEIAHFIANELHSTDDYEYIKLALDICDQWIALYPHYNRIALLKNLRIELTKKELFVGIPSPLYPNESQNIEVSYRNVKEYILNIYRQSDNLSLSAQDKSTPQNGKWSRENRVASISSPAHPNELSLITCKDTIEFPALAPGFYVVESVVDGNTSNTINLSVSSVKTIIRNVAPGEIELSAVDSKSGEPLANASIQLYNNTWRNFNKKEVLQKTLQCDQLGLCRIKLNPQNGWTAKVVIPGDNFSTPMDLYNPYAYTSNDKEETKTTLFTDRSVYRPGQTVYFSGIRYINTLKTNKVVPNEKVTATLLDASGNTVSSIKLTTDEYGQFNGSFVIPRGLMLGDYSIQVNNQYTSSGHFSVEEYKLPMFKVEFNPVKEGGKFGKRLSIIGTANSYTGVPQTGATVEYTILQQKNPYRWRLSSPEQIESGTTTVDTSGHFAIEFTPQRDNSADFINQEQAYIYTIRATITAPTGESVEQSTWVAIGDSPYFVSVTAPQLIDKYQSAGKIKSQVLTLNGEPVKREQRLVFYSLYDNGSTQELDSLKIKMQVGEATISANGDALYPDFTQWASGPYRIVAFSSDESGNTIQGECNFILYSDKDKSPARHSILWLPRTEWAVQTGETVEIPVGSSLKDAWVFYSIYSSKRLLETKVLKLNNSCQNLNIKFDDRFEGLATIKFLIVKEGKITTMSVTIRHQEPSRDLTITTSSFRDKLSPGTTEQWSFTVTDAEGKPVIARFMAEMFDASMQAIRTHEWSFNTQKPQLYIQISTSTRSSSSKNRYLDFSKQQKRFGVPREIATSFIYSEFRSEFFYSGNIYAYRSSTPHLSAPISADMEVMCMEEEGTADTNTAEDSKLKATYAETTKKPDEYRTGEISTVFFYPTLMPDSLGKVNLSFTVPNENASWQFFALAYTQKLLSGGYEAQAISSKPVMISPNLPRFVRQADEVSIATAVQNRTQQSQEGEVLFELFNPYTEEVLHSSRVPFLVEAEESQTLNYRFTAPSDKSVIGFRVKAQTAQHSDGEQQILPILPSKVLVTDSKPFFIPSGTETTAVTLPNMKKKLQSSRVESYRMTLQYCNNPTWYAVQALPPLSEPTGNDAISIMANLFSNSVASKLATDNPRIAQAIEAWKAAGGKNLTSPLAQNEELKQILLSATPWVLDATNETEQMQQLATLFDKNRANLLTQEAIRKLGNLQDEDGGICWFSGMESSFTVSLNTLEGFSRMQALGIELSPDIYSMQEELIRYIDQKIVKFWDEYYRTNSSSSTPSLHYSDILYLYVRSGYRDYPLTDKALTYHKKMMEQLKSWSHLNDYEKAYAAVTLYRYGFNNEAQAIINSLRQYAVTTPDKGMFWPNSRSSYHYQNGAVQKECAMFQAFAEVNPVTAELDAMRQWLLTQKQTNQWASIPSTLDAIYMLLTQGSDWLAADKEQTTITWGDKSLEVTPNDAFTGVSEYTLNGSEVTPAHAKVDITTHHAQPSWGAIYWQYYDDVKNVESASVKDLKLHRQLFVREQTDENTTYIPLNTTSIKPGDRIAVRLTITVGQDMQFVCLTDNRAACFEPAEQLSGYKYRERIGYYEEIGNTATRFYFEFLPKGTYVITYELNVDRQGEYTQGLSTIQCLYAPQIIARSAAQTIVVQ